MAEISPETNDAISHDVVMALAMVRSAAACLRMLEGYEGSDEMGDIGTLLQVAEARLLTVESVLSRG